MNELPFPITGSLRLPILVVESIFIFISFELALIFLFKYLREERDLRNPQALAFASLFSGIAVCYFFFVIGDYYVSADTQSPFWFWTQASERLFFLNLGYLALFIGALQFIVFIETDRQIFFKKYFGTYIFSVCLVIFLLLFLVDMRLPSILQYILWPIFVIFFLLYIYNIAEGLKTKRSRFASIIFYSFPLLIVALGYFLTVDAAILQLGLQARFIGSLIMLLGLIIVYLTYNSLPAFQELNWQEDLEEIYVLDKSGLCICHEAFKEGIEFFDKTLASGAIMTVNMMLSQLISNERNGISTIKKKGKVVKILSESELTVIAVCDKDLNIVDWNLKQFARKFEEIYSKILKGWDGNLKIFAPVKHMVHETFKK